VHRGNQTFLIVSLIIIVSASLGFTYRRINDTDHHPNYEDQYNDFYLNNGFDDGNYYNSSSFSNIFFSSDSTDSIEAALNSFLLETDSLTTDSLLTDSIAVVDSMALDSTARLKYFRYSREDNQSVEFTEGKGSNFFAYPSNRYLRRTVELDSSGQYVLIKEKIAGEESKVFLKVAVDDYIKWKMEEINRGEWEKLGHKYELKEGTKDLGKLLSDITNIEIPLPSASFLSIFGPPKISLRINGAVDIHGAFRSEETEGQTLSRLGNTRNEPDFSQQVQVSVSGMIGDKLTINADWNTERTFEFENQLKLTYKGYEDEIIQSIEAGNVSLQTSPLVGGSEALFGIKAKFQFGPFTLTALASQKKGEVKEISVGGGGQKTEFEIHAYQYSTNHYFLDEIYADTTADYNFFNNYYGEFTPVETGNSQFYYVKEVEIWKTTTGIIDPGRERKVNAFIDLESIPNGGAYDPDLKDTLNQLPITGKSMINARFIQLTEGVDFTFQPYTGHVSFNTQIQTTDAIAVAYRIEGESSLPEDDLFFGEFTKNLDDTTVILLKLIKPQNLQPSFKEAWKLQLRNFYPLGGRDIKEDEFKLDIFYRTEGQEPSIDYNGHKLLEIFDLDRTDESKTSQFPDGAFDFIPGKTILTRTGEIIFPVLEPFGTQLPSELPDTLAYQSVYDTSKTFAQQDRTKDKFLIKGEYSASVSSSFSIGFNVVENSVRVTLDGRELKAGVDYSVDYNIGQITIRNDAALVPGADLKISYEQNDLFALASKTLMGFRGLYDFSDKTKFGFSFLNLNQQTLSDKVRIGEEPLNNSIFGIDFNTGVDLPFITTVLDKLISTNTMSSLKLKGEFAYMDPDPNTKKSTIAGDDGKSIAFIDDFEGSKRTIPIGISYTGWKDLSVPDELPVIGADDKIDQMQHKGKSYWFNHQPPDDESRSIWPEKEVTNDNSKVSVLDYLFKPGKRGMYNSEPELNDPSLSWGGMMKLLSSSANNLEEEKIEAIELWIQIINAPDNAKFNIDLGQISEDVIPNSRLDTEDKNFNDLIEEGEDTGIDGLRNIEEDGYDAASNPDPNGDDYSYTPSSGIIRNIDFENINGTEGNAVLTDVGKFPDTEDLNRNGNLDRIDSYFRYEIPLSTDSTRNPFVAGGGTTPQQWYQFKIPLKDFTSKVGDPTFSVVEFVRFWMSGVSDSVHIRITDFNLVGNQWEKVIDPPRVEAGDTVLTVSTISVEDNPEYYSPPGVIRETDRTSTSGKNVKKNEQSLQLIFKELADGDNRSVVKYVPKSMDIFNYKEMKLFIHGDLNDMPGSISYYEDSTDYATDLYFRFGSDSTNFYEYRQPTKADWHEISINFDVLTTIKELRPSDTLNTVFSIPVPGKPGHYYGIRGKPTLTRVSFFGIGVVNPGDQGTEFEKVSGDLWVNELRVLGADDTPGWAATGSASLVLADLLTVSANIKQTDPYFHKLSGRFGSRVEKRSWGVQGNLDVINLLPFNLPGSSFNINYSHTESISKPLYKPSTDILVSNSAASSSNPDSVYKVTETATISDTWSAQNIKLRLPSKKWFIRDTFNGITFGFNYNSNYSRNPTTAYSTGWLWNASGRYSVNLPKDNFIYPANIPIVGIIFKIFTDYRNFKFYYTPQTINFGVSAKRNWSATQSRSQNVAANIRRDFTATRNGAFGWKITDGGLLNISLNYSLDILSSLAYLLTDEEGIDRPDKEIWSDIFGGEGFGNDFNYKQSFDLRLKPKMPSLFGLDKNFTFSTGYSVTYNWQNNFQQLELGRNAGFTNRINASLQIRLKSIMDPLFTFGDKKTAGTAKKTPSRRSRNQRLSKDIDKNIKKDNDENIARNSKNDSTQVEMKSSLFNDVLGVMLRSVQWVFFDYDQISFNFTHSNTKGSGGLASTGTGFWNFWGAAQDPVNGPSRLFQLGLSSDAGPRAIGGTLSDKFSQKNNFDIKTRRPLWEGANLDVSFKVGWGYNESTSIRVDSLTGETILVNRTATGNIDRSFLTIPMAGANMEAVNELYDPNSENANLNLASAFVEGLESFPLLASVPFFSDVAQYIPRPNWKISWSGLEKLPVFDMLFKRVSLNHAYMSSYLQGWKVNPDGNEEVITQKVTYGFAPLLGLNLTFAELFGGNLTGSVKFSTKTNYDLGLSTKTTTESLSKDINISLSFSKSGFELPLFGVSLKNDIEISFAYTLGRNSVIIYDMGDKFTPEGRPQDGTTRSSFEPRIRYVMSSRVTISIFYRRSSVEPEGASRIPATTTNEAGLDVHISIQ